MPSAKSRNKKRNRKLRRIEAEADAVKSGACKYFLGKGKCQICKRTFCIRCPHELKIAS